MSQSYSFRTRARAVDHLGRGQIADCPTAVSELWKNAWDAYARRVELHIFDTSIKSAAIMDNGFGMTKEEFIEKWLVIGTDSKIDDINKTAVERFGLEVRRKQGEKGIGRLSVGFLAPVSLVVSQKSDGRCFAGLVDWRFFENPHIDLSDIQIGVLDLEHPNDVLSRLPELIETLKENLSGNEGSSERQERLKLAWSLWDKQATSLGLKSTSRHIEDSLKKMELSKDQLYQWRDLMEDGAAEHPHGMAMFLFDIHSELAVWLDGGDSQEDVKILKAQFKSKLRAFIDPFDEPETDEERKRKELNYGAYYHIGPKKERIVDNNYAFGLEMFKALEHNVMGSFDEKGVFRAQVTLFQKNIGQVIIPPKIRVYGRNAESYVGPFDFMIGRYEGRESSHTDAEVALFNNQAENHSGLCIYRNNLRVMPYGLEEHDFFHMEKRRSKNAGRFVWSARTSFGKIGLTTNYNPNLRDKAGREGLVDNRASYMIRQLVENVLIELADRYFGRDAKPRKDVRKELVATKKERKRKEVEKKIRKKFFSALKRNEPVLGILEHELKNVETLEQDEQLVRLGEISSATKEIFIEAVTGIGEKEEEYRSYRNRLLDIKDQVKKRQKELTAAFEFSVKSPSDQFEKILKGYQRRLSSRVKQFTEKTDPLILDLDRRMVEINKEYKGQLTSIIDAAMVTLEQDPARTLETVNDKFEELDELLTFECLSFAGSLEQMVEGSDLASTIQLTLEERNQFAKKLQDYTQLAQMGLAMEIVGHELSSLTDRIEFGFTKVDKSNKAVKEAYEAHQDLTRQLKFLAPLEVSRYRSRQTITGKQIADFIGRFFEDRFKRNRISFNATSAFQGIQFKDLQSRIYPVFINLVNNSVYWLHSSDDRKVTFAFQNGKVVIADSGPGIDTDDQSRLFEMFYTKRTEGRGIGLYLCRQNLAVAHHKIRYSDKEQQDPEILDGANFIIEFNNIEVLE